MAHHDHDHEHNHERDAAAQVPYTACVITVSDRCAAGTREDCAGPALVAQLVAAGFDVDPHVVVEPDDAGRIAHAIREAAR
ncbi:molybdopterin-binding protein, partial [uncultured Parolsenella sp.]|uniref:molybdopterin-binding protein n=1 Tax=uncultured Parolsenella sp. TaxID=2083008 RepID=UPI0025FC767E